MDLSNKSLALLLVSAIVISLGGTIVSLNKINDMGITGMASQVSGLVNLSIDTNSSCTLDKSIQFGAGKPTQERTLSSDANNNFDGWTCDGSSASSNCMGVVINNTGNVLLDISFNSSHTGATLLGGLHTVSDFTWIPDDTEIEANSCTSEPTSWQNVATSAPNQSSVCAGLNYSDSRDIIVIDFNVTVDQNTAPGTKTATITVGCIAS